VGEVVSNGVEKLEAELWWRWSFGGGGGLGGDDTELTRLPSVNE
jgi:hypothetical protein